MIGSPLIRYPLVAGSALAVAPALGCNLRGPATEQSPRPAAGPPAADGNLNPSVIVDPAVLQRNLRPRSLYLPTSIEKLGEQYFIVGCYNNHVLCRQNLDAPLNDRHAVLMFDCECSELVFNKALLGVD